VVLEVPTAMDHTPQWGPSNVWPWYILAVLGSERVGFGVLRTLLPSLQGTGRAGLLQSPVVLSKVAETESCDL
jgi:hypothetical protein